MKGKGNLMTYYLLGKAGKITPPTAPVSPAVSVANGGTPALTASASESATTAGDESSQTTSTSKSDDRTDKTVIECADARSDVFNDDGATSRDMTENTLLLSDT